MVVVRRGVTRTVFLVWHWAIKVPAFRPIGGRHGIRGRVAGFATGYLANLSEQTWSSYRPWSEGVAPVLRSWLWGVIQVYPRCDPVDQTDWVYDGDPIAIDSGWRYKGKVPLPVLYPEPGDFKADNFGWLDGRIVRVDYSMER